MNTTPIRGFRVPDEEYLPAKEVAQHKSESLTDVVRRALVTYVWRNRWPVLADKFVTPERAAEIKERAADWYGPPVIENELVAEMLYTIEVQAAMLADADRIKR